MESQDPWNPRPHGIPGPMESQAPWNPKNLRVPGPWEAGPFRERACAAEGQGGHLRSAPPSNRARPYLHRNRTATNPKPTMTGAFKSV